MKIKGYIFLLMSILLVSCKSEYDKIVKAELAKGESITELPLGLRTGMTKKEYFADCWQMNSDAKISQGPGNQYAQYFLLPQASQDSIDMIRMLFYGMFDEKEIMHGLDMIMEFITWSPWNEAYHSPALISTLEQEYMTTYQGNKFITVKVNEEVDARVKVDANRRITIYPLSERKVAVKIVDLLHEDEIIE